MNAVLNLPFSIVYIQGSKSRSLDEGQCPVLVVKDGPGADRIVGLDSNFKCWCSKDCAPTTSALAQMFLDDLHIKRIEILVTTEGSALVIDGYGDTDTSLINENGNPGKPIKSLVRNSGALSRFRRSSEFPT